MTQLPGSARHGDRDPETGRGVAVLASGLLCPAGPSGQVGAQGAGSGGRRPGHHQSEARAGDSTLLPALTSGPFRPRGSGTGT